jgi:hypothetical protein
MAVKKIKTKRKFEVKKIKAKKVEKPLSEDYLKEYENALQFLVKSCGSKENANRMIEELHVQYEKTTQKIEELKEKYPEGTAEYEKEKIRILEEGKYEIHKIIEKYIPHVSNHLEELIIGTSLAVAATFMPTVHLTSLFATITSILAIGGSYYIGFKTLKNWKLLVHKNKVADLSVKLAHKKAESKH